MAIDVILKKVSTRLEAATASHVMLVPTDARGIEVIHEIGTNEEVRCVITRPRNLKHHRKFFALIGVVFKAQGFYATQENMLDDIKLAIGHSRQFIGHDGLIRIIPNSISFANMDQSEFEQFYNKAVEFILSKILPAVDKADLEQQVYDVLGEPGPSVLER